MFISLRSLRLLLPLVCCLALLPGCDLDELLGDTPNNSGSGGGSQPTLVVINQSSRTVNAVYFSACSDPYWGSNRLSGTMGPNASRSWNVSSGCYDIRATNTNGGEWTQFGAQISGTYTLRLNN